MPAPCRPRVMGGGACVAVVLLACVLQHRVATAAVGNVRHTYVICDPRLEPERHAAVSPHVANVSETTFYKPTDNRTGVPPALMAEWGIAQGALTQPEASLYINYAMTMQRVRDDFPQGGNFIVLESDVQFHGNFSKYIEDMAQAAEGIPFDLIFFGSCMGFHARGPRARGRVSLVRMTSGRCTDSILWSHTGVLKFLDFLHRTTNATMPIDHTMNVFLKNETTACYWAEPTLTTQGSQTGAFPSTIRGRAAMTSNDD